MPFLSLLSLFASFIMISLLTTPIFLTRIRPVHVPPCLLVCRCWSGACHTNLSGNACPAREPLWSTPSFGIAPHIHCGREDSISGAVPPSQRSCLVPLASTSVHSPSRLYSYVTGTGTGAGIRDILSPCSAPDRHVTCCYVRVLPSQRLLWQKLGWVRSYTCLATLSTARHIWLTYVCSHSHDQGAMHIMLIAEPTAKP